MKNFIRKLYHLPLFKQCPRGFDLAHNLARFLPEWKCGVIFDVGANIGQSAQEFANRFNYSEIHCFEPFPATFNDLRNNTLRIRGIHLHPYALSSTRSTLKVQVGSCSTNNSITSAVGVENPGMTEVEIETRTLTDVFQSMNLQCVSFMKIDTEGHDLEVLQGGEHLLLNQKIDVIQVEAGMNPTNKHHVPFEVLKSYLESKNYFLFGVFEQTGEFMSGHPAMRRANCVFISSKMNDKNQKV